MEIEKGQSVEIQLGDGTLSAEVGDIDDRENLIFVTLNAEELFECDITFSRRKFEEVEFTEKKTMETHEQKLVMTK